MKIIKARSKISDFGLIKGQYYRVKSIGSRWYSVRIEKGFWSTIAKMHFDDIKEVVQ